MSNVSSVLYDIPGPVTKRRQRRWSVVAGLAIFAVLGAGLFAMYRNGVFDERWMVLIDPPNVRGLNSTAADVWWNSLIMTGLIQGTLAAAGLAMPIAGLVALILVVLRTSTKKAVSVPAKVLIEVSRGLPVLVLMLFGLFVFNFSAYVSVAFGLIVYNAAILAEILRAGLASIAKGQGEAGMAIGLSWFQNFFIITLPQAIRVMMPSLIAQLVVLLKDTSIGFIVGYTELLRTGQVNWNFFGNETRLPFFVAVLAIYLVLNFSLTRIATFVEKRLRERGQRATLPGGIAATLNPRDA
ncbi:amino acid ABC transporter permease [Pseudactinotalea sp. Z1748]|uniref:amino acid ABC transporter permease n=1 Tax=Pseudactinotalea sp. Z1748 TaxID=3413027 RepID=UPI003C7EBE85